MITFVCLDCGKRLKADRDLVGRQIRCTGCGSAQRVPAVSVPKRRQAATQTAAVVDPGQPDSQPQDSPLNLRRRMLDDDGLDMTPMVDCTFLLLIFFMITAAFALQKSIQIPPPDVSEASTQTQAVEEPEEDDYVVVMIDAESRVWIDDVEAPSSHEVLARLKAAREGSGTGSQGPGKLLIQASEDARHEVVVMVMDMGAEAGMDGVRLAGLAHE